MDAFDEIGSAVNFEPDLGWEHDGVDNVVVVAWMRFECSRAYVGARKLHGSKQKSWRTVNLNRRCGGQIRGGIRIIEIGLA
jgi:hypothetical protein